MPFVPSNSQKKRRERSIGILRKRNYLIYEDPLYSIDDSQAVLREPNEVATRALILWMVALYADATPQDEVLEVINEHRIWDKVSPEEIDFLNNRSPNSQDKLGFKWRLESAWILLWALKKICILNWPTKLCDCRKMVNVFRSLEHSGGLDGHFSLKNKNTILDVLDLTFRQNWAARQDRILFLETVSPEEASVVQQRHHALNWLVSLDNASWDKVPTHT